jgi:hypothetical protein
MKPKKLTLGEEQARHFVELRQKGVCVEDIAECEGVGVRLVNRVLSVVKAGYGSYHRYLASLAGKNGHSLYEYRQRLEEKKSKTLTAGIWGEYIHTELVRVGEKPVWLARKAGLSKVSISKYIRGRTLPNDENFRKIAGIFGAQYDTLDDMVIDYCTKKLLHKE